MQFDNEEDLKRQLTRRNSQRPTYHGPIKRIKETPVVEKAFYIIQNKIYLFTAINNFQEIILELNNITQSISRPLHINEFEFTQGSLLRAKSLGYTQKRVKDFLSRNMRNHSIPQKLQKMIEIFLGQSLCPKLYLVEEKQRNIYLFEISESELNIRPALLEKISEFTEKKHEILNEDQKRVEQDKREVIQQQWSEVPLNQKAAHLIRRYQVKDYQHNFLAKYMFQQKIPLSSQKIIKKNELEQKMKNETQLIRNLEALHCKDLKINLKAFTKLRDYQAEALRSVVSTKENYIVAKSGYIVLPCGAGKTLLGISICTKVKKETLIVCSNDAGCQQWKREIEKWTQGLHKDTIIILTAKTMSEFKYNIQDKKGHIFISTYSNLKSKFDPREGGMQKKYEWLKKMPWGLIVFDEAQWLPAEQNSLIVNSMLAHVKIGLTATPLREDKKIQSLVYLIGPQLYVGSWKKFVEQGFLANPKCLQIRTSLTTYFRNQYELASTESGTQRIQSKELIYESNPNKIKALLFLLEYHEALNDNIIVFCDKIKLITFLARKLKRPLLAGDTSNEDRNFVFDMFRTGKFKTIFLTRIGDEAIDLPNANVGIEIAMSKGSRRQMMQRLGRIMRPKESSSSETYNAVFYTIVSDKTLEMKYFEKRRNYLVNLGFQYDLRLFEYDKSQTVEDILHSDEEKKQVVEQKFKELIPDEFKYHLMLKEDKS